LRNRKPDQEANGLEVVLLCVGGLALQEGRDALLLDRGNRILTALELLLNIAARRHDAHLIGQTRLTPWAFAAASFLAE
jgi:hypothetical protein